MKKAITWSKILLLLIVFSAVSDSLIAQKHIARDFSSNVRLNDINPQAFRHFKRTYPSVSNEYWNKTDEGFAVKFIDNKDIITQVFYDHRGAFMYGVKYLEEKDLGKEIRSRVQKEFPHYQIDVVSEINSDDNVMYLMSIKNRMSVKNIMVTESELKVVEDIMYASR